MSGVSGAGRLGSPRASDSVAGGLGFVDQLSLLPDKAADLHANDPRLAAFTAVATIELQRSRNPTAHRDAIDAFKRTLAGKLLPRR
jgi:phage tail tape-measure protein